MSGAVPISMRGAAPLLGRDLKVVHVDVQKLLQVGIVLKRAKGRIDLPFDAVPVHFKLEVA